MVDVVEIDYGKASHREALLTLMQTYALDQMGGGQSMPQLVLDNLVAEMRKRSNIHVILAFDQDRPAGLINCVEGFSTFACQPLLNIHDVIVDPGFRRQGVASLMLKKVEQLAYRLGACKLTLEVLEGNVAAKTVYRQFGFSGYQLNPEMGQALFWEKKLSSKAN